MLIAGGEGVENGPRQDEKGQLSRQVLYQHRVNDAIGKTHPRHPPRMLYNPSKRGIRQVTLPCSSSQKGNFFRVCNDSGVGKAEFALQRLLLRHVLAKARREEAEQGRGGGKVPEHHHRSLPPNTLPQLSRKQANVHQGLGNVRAKTRQRLTEPVNVL